ncbi:MAG: hypothetical protein M3393_02865 [Actinomycetota bacterium]|nr:hypothetical protein [Actinomycetota bacterium]
MSTSPPLPQSAAFALWYSAWAAGATSLDDARDAVVGTDAGHDVLGLPGEGDAVPLILAFGRLRSAGAISAGIALPVPGDPLGLAGPDDFNIEAIGAGECVVFESADIGLVPQRTGAAVVWRCHRAVARRQIPDLSEADTLLRGAVLATANTLADLDVARWRPEAADELMALRRPADFNFPSGTVPRVLRVASLSARCRSIVDLALDCDGAAITARQAEQRRAALAPLDHAARRGLVAACSHPWGR